MRKDQVKKFWAIYRSQDFKKEIQKLFNKVKQYASFVKLDEQYPRKVVGLAINRSSSFVTKSLNVYDRFIRSFEKKEVTLDTKICDLVIFVPKFQSMIKALERSKLTVRDLFNRDRFWKLHVKGIGPKNFAYFLYCLEHQGLTIRAAKWCKK